jgi:hypothetical protein
MKQSSAAAPRKPLDRKTAKACLVVNQFATPGLGSLLGRRFVAGTLQLVLAVFGFCLLMLWFVCLLRNTYVDLTGGRRVPAHGEYGVIGALSFLASWLWAWVTSFSLIREAKNNPEPVEPPLSQPPKL